MILTCTYTNHFCIINQIKFPRNEQWKLMHNTSIIFAHIRMTASRMLALASLSIPIAFIHHSTIGRGFTINMLRYYWFSSRYTDESAWSTSEAINIKQHSRIIQCNPGNGISEIKIRSLIHFILWIEWLNHVNNTPIKAKGNKQVSIPTCCHTYILTFFL